MPGVVESLDLISKTIESILDFVANDKVLSDDFQQYLEINEIEVNSEKEFNNIIIQYVLDMKMQNGLRVLEYYRRNNNFCEEILSALQNSFCSVFRINKILSNAYEAKCLTSNVDLTLIPMVKMFHLKQIGKFDFIQSRIIELGSTCYILEIYDVISEFNVAKANEEAIKYMLQNPKCAYFKNENKKLELEKSVAEFDEKFNDCFNSRYVVTTNKFADKLIEFFNVFRLEGVKNDYSSLIQEVDKNRFFKVKEYNCDDKTFMDSAIGGFSSHEDIYDVGLWMDKKRGLYIIPFLDTFFKLFNSETDGAFDCVKEFLTSDKVPPSVLKYAYDNNPNFLKVINEALKTNFSNFEEVLFNTKTAFLDEGIYSPVTTLFNSELFSNLIGIDENKEPTKST